MKSYDTGPISPPLLEQTIGENFEQTVAANPDGEALVDLGKPADHQQRWTYAELNTEIDLIARGLMSLGVQAGDRVGMWSPNCAEWTILQYAAAKIGAILVNINPAYRTHELEYVLNQSGVRTLVAATAFKSSDYQSMIEQVRPAAAHLCEAVFVGTDDWTELQTRAERVSADALRTRMAPLANRDPINIQYTGFDAGSTLAAVQREHCTGLYGVPTMFIAMLSHPDFADTDLSSLRTGMMAGSVCPVEVMKRCVAEMNMAEVAIAYGMTETSPVSCQTLIDDDLQRRTATIGRVHPHVEIKIVDPDTGGIVKRGRPGELCTRGYSVMLGYWRDDVRTREVIDGDGWMHTGDLAVMRGDGYCTIAGRRSDVVIRGGENIYPREIEEFLATHPDIDEAQVVGVPDVAYGEEICAWIRVRAGRPALDADAVRAFCTGRIAHYKIPRYVHVVEEFPMTVTGKVRKVEMRAESARLFGLKAPGTVEDT